MTVKLHEPHSHPMTLAELRTQLEKESASRPYFSNINAPQSPSTLITVSATEQRAEYGIMLGTRLMQRDNGDGFTLDIFGGYDIGYRMFDVDPAFASIFSGLDQSNFSHSFRFGLNFGYSFSFDGRR